jgi:thiol:disulfide interchange protein DsbA
MNNSNVFRATRRGVLVVFALGVIGIGSVAAQNLVEGQNYLRLKNPQPVDSGKKIEVLYFFSFGCPHCRDFDPELQKWKRTLDADVDFKRVPVDFGREQWANLGKMWYTLESIGADDKMTSELFAALHDKKAPLHQDKAFFDWAASKGLDRKKVEDMYNSFGVSGKMNRARRLTKDYGVQSIPVVYVDGKFQVTADKVGGHAAMPAAMNQLISKARGERPKS